MGLDFISEENDTPNNPEDPGIISRAARHIFQLLQQRRAGNSSYNYALHASFLELYNEDFKDLLTSKAIKRSKSVGSLQNKNQEFQKSDIIIRDDKKGKVVVTGVKEEIVTCENDIIRYVRAH